MTSPARVAELAPDDIACLIFTSGTGGAPKGVMTTHRNILANCRGAFRLLETLGLGDEVFLSFLPLSHSYEHTAGMMFPISIGAQIYFAEGAETLAANLARSAPDDHDRGAAALRDAAPAHHARRRAQGQDGAQDVRQGGGDRPQARGAGAAPASASAWSIRCSTGSVRAGLRRRFGGRLKAMVSGGARAEPRNRQLLPGARRPLLQGYGQTEAAPVIACNVPSRIKIDTVGPPLDGVRVRIAEDGEILVAGDNVMKGYWNDPQATAQALVDGWLHTGDVGWVDDDGYIHITDRKRDFIKNSGGEMISPARVEGYLTLEPEIAQAMVFGDRRPYLVAVVVPDADFARGFRRRERRRRRRSRHSPPTRNLPRRSAPRWRGSTAIWRRSSGCGAS